METKYRFLGTAATIFKVIGWIVLVLGIIGSIIMAIGMGTVFGDVQPGLGGLSVLYAIFGIVYSVAGWVFFLALAEVLHLLVDLERNTRETADRLRVGSIDKSA